MLHLLAVALVDRRSFATETLGIVIYHVRFGCGCRATGSVSLLRLTVPVLIIVGWLHGLPACRVVLLLL